MASTFIVLGFLIAIFPSTLASDPSPLQDFCVADYTSSVRVNGFTCKDPVAVNVNDFTLGGFDEAGNGSNRFGANVISANVFEIPGINTLGISMTRAEFAPGQIAPLHIHPRGSEILTVLAGTIEVGFVTSSPENRLISKVLHKGDVFVVPINLVHYKRNVGKDNAITIVAFSTQFPGITFVGNAGFGSKPAVPNDVLAKSFRTDDDTINSIRSRF